MSKLYDYLLDKYGLGVHDESDMDIIRDIVLEEAGFKWIPVSERFPEKVRRGKSKVIRLLKSRKVFVTFAFTDLSENINVAEAIYRDGEFLLLTDRGMYYSGNPLVSVIAWMPLPKPYKP